MAELRVRFRLVVVNATLLATHPLPVDGNVVVGRGTEAQISIPDSSVSRRHALLTLGPTLVLEDLGSANGTSVNGIRLAPGRPVGIGPNDSIRLGHVALVLQHDRGEFDGPERDAGATLSLMPDRGRDGSGPTLDDLVVNGQPVSLRTEAMRTLYAEVGRVGRSAINVLILGETGTGKEVIARAIHEASSRRDMPFLGINCAALSEPLLESELFGHEKGAFSGAHETKPGLLERSRGGTVFLDEVGEMSLAIQAKLLRVFEERLVLRLGSVEARPIDVRFVTATNRDLEREVETGRFRQDFYYRLNGVMLHAPPLRERPADVEPLARIFLESAAAQSGRRWVPDISAEALDLLRRYPWPGNVRELRNAIERALVLCDDGPIRPEHVRVAEAKARFDQTDANLVALPDPAPSRTAAKRADTPPSSSLSRELDEIERGRILDAMASCGGNQTRAAKLLGMARRTLIRKLDLYGIQRPRKG